jgi:RsiW-degrading membrane proteinase PrsW (M82 family)
MGTQQILLIVLSVIIVGAAIAVGIQMFNNQSYSANKSAIAADAQSFASQIVQYYKTPISQGGAGQPTTTMDAAAVGGFIGWGAAVTNNDNGNYIVVPQSATTVYVYGIGKEEKDSKKPAVRTTVTLPAGCISAQVIDAASTTTTGNVANAGFTGS